MKEGVVTAGLFGFLTCDPNAEVGAIHPRAMPVILTAEEERETWLRAVWSEAGALQRPLPDGSLQIVARGSKQDGDINPVNLAGQASAAHDPLPLLSGSLGRPEDVAAAVVENPEPADNGGRNPA